MWVWRCRQYQAPDATVTRQTAAKIAIAVLRRPFFGAEFPIPSAFSPIPVPPGLPERQEGSCLSESEPVDERPCVSVEYLLDRFVFQSNRLDLADDLLDRPHAGGVVAAEEDAGFVRVERRGELLRSPRRARNAERVRCGSPLEHPDHVRQVQEDV